MSTTNQLPQIISVGILFNTDYIVENSGTGTCDSPALVANQDKCIFMVSDCAHELSGHGYSELNIRASRGDQIIWRATALDFGGTKVPYLYQFVATSGEGNMQDIEIKSIETDFARPKTNHGNEPPDCNMVLSKPRIGEISASVMYSKGITYHIRFMIVEPTGPGESDFNVIGYYYWDPFINWG